MSAAPKLNPDFWMTSHVAELSVPELVEIPTSPSGSIVHTPPLAKEVTAPRISFLPPLALIFKFERAISLAIIIFALMTLATFAHQGLTAKINARDLRVAIQETDNGIGIIRADLQQARMNLERSDAPEGYRTLPIEPGDVTTIVLPSGR